MTSFRVMMVGLAGGMLAFAAPAMADVKAGVEAWGNGDYGRAVAEWRQPAAAGDADAQFNLAQAYRLGRGVEADQNQAETLYQRAAAKGHLKAADNYGLLLFQDGRREQAMPYVVAAAERGDPRSQYLLGIAHFNGDMVEKDWERAYALLTLANGAGLPQAAPAIMQMDSFIPLVQRERAQNLATQMKRDADARRASQMAAADLSMGQQRTASAPLVSQPAPFRPAAPRAVASGASNIPRSIPSIPMPPSSVAVAQAAVAEAARVTGTSSPSEAGADFARPTVSSAPAPALAPARAAATPTRSAPIANTSASGPWRVQLGAFSVRGNAERLWGRLSGSAALSGKQSFFVPAGRLTKLQAGGFSSRGSAQSACNTIKRSGQVCIVTR